MAKTTKEDVLEYLESANMLEVSELIKDIEDKFGVSSAAPIAVAAGPGPDGAAEGSSDAESKDEFDIELTDVGFTYKPTIVLFASFARSTAISIPLSEFFDPSNGTSILFILINPFC